MPLRSKTWICVVFDRERQGFVEAGCEPLPADRSVPQVQAADQPHVAVERHAHASPVFEKLNVSGTDVPPPRVVDRQREVVYDVGILRRRHRDPRRHLLRPPARGRSGWNRRRGHVGHRWPVGVRDTELNRVGVCRHSYSPHLGRPTAGDGGVDGERLDRRGGTSAAAGRDRAIRRLGSEHQPQWVACGPDGHCAHDRRSAVAFRDGHPLADVCAANDVLEDRAAAHEAHSLEAREVGRHRSSADFRRSGRRFARVVE